MNVITNLWNKVPAAAKTWLRGIVTVAVAAAAKTIILGGHINIDPKAVLTAVVAALTPVVLVALDKTDPRYGIGKK